MQKPNCRASGGSEGLQHGEIGVEAKVVAPMFFSRIEKLHCLAGLRVYCGDVRSFKSIAEQAGVRQVFESGSAPVLTAYDMVDLVRKAGVVLMDPAIFATKVSSPGYLIPKFRGNVTGHAREFAVLSPSPFSECAPAQ